MLDRMTEMGRKGVADDQLKMLAGVLAESKTCYEFYNTLKTYMGSNADWAKVLKTSFEKLGLGEIKLTEKSLMPAEEQFAMWFDELYQVSLGTIKESPIEAKKMADILRMKNL